MLGDFLEGGIAIVAEQEIGGSVVLSDVEVKVSIPVVVEYGYAWVSVYYERLVTEGLRRDVGKRSYLVLLHSVAGV